MKKIISRIPIIKDYIKARELSEKTIKEYFKKKEALELAQQETQNALELFGRVKIEVLNRTMHPFLEQLSRIDDIEISEESPRPNSQPQNKSITEQDPGEIEADHALTATVAAGGIGAASAAITYAAVGTLGTASTGAVISTLSGAAASNATLAFLGGGSLAAGGAGVVGGIAVLGGLCAIPVLAVGGYFFKKKANQKLQKAKEDAEQVRQFIEESDTAINELSNIRNKTFHLHRLLVPFETIFIPNIKTLSEIIDNASRRNIVIRLYYSIKKFIAEKISKMGYNPPVWIKKGARIRFTDFAKNDKHKVEECITAGQMLKNILDINLINDEGIVPEETIQFISTIEEYLNNTTQHI
jgi:hypothetical protein